MLPAFKQGELSQRRPEYMAWGSLLQSLGVRTYVELGSTYGSANYIRELGIRVVAVDMINEPSGGYFPDIPYLKMDSHDPKTLAAAVEILGGVPDAAFIDADHDYEPVKADFNLWWPNVKIVLGFHDVLIPDVRRFWNETCLGIPNGAIEIIGRDYASLRAWQGPGAPADGQISGGGIGVFFKESTP